MSMASNPRDKLNRLLGRRDTIAQQLREAEAGEFAACAEFENSKQAFDIASAVMVRTQSEVKEFIERSVTLALQSVFGEFYAFAISYQTKRNQSEAVLSVMKDGEPYSPEDESGGGIIDVTAFGLRLALWSLSGSESAPVFLLDEPARNLSRDKLELFGLMLRKLSEMFRVQIIQISHDPTLIEGSDRSFMVTQRKGVSSVKLLE